MSSSTNQDNNQRLTTSTGDSQFTYSDDDFRSGCRNVSQCHKQSFSGLLTLTIIPHRLRIMFARPFYGHLFFADSIKVVGLSLFLLICYLSVVGSFYLFCRSHTFAVRQRPSDLQNVKIHNLNVRGKRGNIVQVYPGVEYDFVPNTMRVKNGDYIHFQ